MYNKDEYVENLFSIKRYQDVIAIRSKQILAGENEYGAYADIARAYIELNDYDNARENCVKAIKSDPAEPLGYYLLSIVFFHLGDDKNALLYAGKAVSIVPDNAECLHRLAESQANIGDTRALKKTVEALLKVAPNTKQAFNALSTFKALTKQYSEAEIYIRECLKIEPESEVYLNNLACVLSYQKKFKEAIDVSKRVLRINAKNEIAKTNMLFAMNKVKNRPFTFFEKSKVNDPVFEKLKEFGSQYWERKRIQLKETQPIYYFFRVTLIRSVAFVALWPLLFLYYIVREFVLYILRDLWLPILVIIFLIIGIKLLD